MDKATFRDNDDVDFFVSSIVTIDNQPELLWSSEERRTLVLMKDLEKTCASLLKCKGRIFQCKDGKNLLHSDWGGRFLDVIRNPMLERVQLNFPECRLNPFVKVVLDATELFNAGKYVRELTISAHLGKVKSIADMLNKLVGEIRSRMKCKSFNKAWKNYKRGAAETRRVLTEMVNGAFKKYAKILVVRLDLSYKKISYRPLDQQNINHSDVGRNLRSLLTDLKGKLFKDRLITYAWKLEYGPLRGYHYHVFFFFDGSRCRQDIDIANQIGEHWTLAITKGSGSYFNCNAIKDKYPLPGIGMIDHRDWWRIDNLKNKALEYLVKVDYYIRPIAGKRIRTLGTGASLKSYAPKKGRPRGIPSIEFGLRSRIAESAVLKSGTQTAK